jgi:transcription-repair coupling factor (superfamily II helicase)
MIDGRAVDLLEIEYAEGNKLLVPVENIRLVQKFSGVDDAPPALDRLGSGRWKRRREKAGEDIERMARELLDLYARREIAQRDPFSPERPRRLNSRPRSSTPKRPTRSPPSRP